MFDSCQYVSFVFSFLILFFFTLDACLVIWYVIVLLLFLSFTSNDMVKIVVLHISCVLSPFIRLFFFFFFLNQVAESKLASVRVICRQIWTEHTIFMTTKKHTLTFKWNDRINVTGLRTEKMNKNKTFKIMNE